MKLFYTLLVWGITLNIACYLMWVFNVVPGIGYPINMQQVTDWFNIGEGSAFWTQFAIVSGISSALGLAFLLLRQGTYAIYAILLWVMGIFLIFASGFFLAIPNTLMAFIPTEVWNMTNPLAYAENGVMVYPTHPIIVVIALVFAFAVWIFMMELASQRSISQ